MPNVYFTTKIENPPSLLPGGANEQYYLDLMADEITSCLNSNGISYFTKDTAPTDSVEIGLNASFSSDNQTPGIKIMFPIGDPESNRLSSIMFENIKRIYYDPSNVRIQPEEMPQSAGKTKSVISFENLQNPENLLWIRQNIDNLSKEIIMSLTEFFGLPYVPCEEIMSGMALKDESIRKRPNLNSEVVGSTKANEKINVFGQWEDWYIVGKNGDLGYIQTQFIEI